MSHENLKKIGLGETKLFHFHGLFETGGDGWGFEQTHWNPSGSAIETRKSIHCSHTEDSDQNLEL